MAKGVAAGILGGALAGVAAVGLGFAVLSVIAPPPGAPGTGAPPVVASDVAAPDVVTPAPIGGDDPQTEAPVPLADVGDAPEADRPDPPAAAAPVEDGPDDALRDALRAVNADPEGRTDTPDTDETGTPPELAEAPGDGFSATAPDAGTEPAVPATEHQVPAFALADSVPAPSTGAGGPDAPALAMTPTVGEGPRRTADATDPDTPATPADRLADAMPEVAPAVPMAQPPTPEVATNSAEMPIPTDPDPQAGAGTRSAADPSTDGTGPAPLDLPAPDVRLAHLPVPPLPRPQAGSVDAQPSAPGDGGTAVAPAPAASVPSGAAAGGLASPDADNPPANAAAPPAPVGAPVPAPALVMPDTPAPDAPSGRPDRAPEGPAGGPMPLATTTADSGPEPGAPAPALQQAAAPPPDADALAERTPPLPTHPRAGFSESVPGVRLDRLPRIGDPVAPDEAADADPAAIAAATDDGDDPRPAVERYAIPFENPDGMPPMVVILLDEGADPTTRAALARLDFPVTIAIDPLREDAVEVTALYRARGFEVVALAGGLPQGATPSDVEISLAAWLRGVPQAVAVLDAPEGGVQGDRLLAQALVAALAEDGHGLITHERGLNPADQVARSAGLPAARVFRLLDAEGENPHTVRRYLDRAAFRAAQEGHVVVMGRTLGDTVAGLVAWRMEGRAGSVALAPVSVVLGR